MYTCRAMDLVSSGVVIYIHLLLTLAETPSHDRGNFKTRTNHDTLKEQPLHTKSTSSRVSDNINNVDKPNISANNQKNLRGKPGQGYYIEVEIGTPPQKLNVLVDTGSANFAVAAAPNPAIDRYFVRKNSSSYRNVGTVVYVPYTQGHWKGLLGTDIVVVGSALPNVSVRTDIACIESSKKFFIDDSNWNGIMGLGYAAIARPDSSVTPYFDLLIQHTRTPNLFSIQLCGTVDTQHSDDVEMGGTLMLGWVDPSMYKGEIYYAPLHKEWYYDIVITDIQINKHSLQLPCVEYNIDKTIVDSGTTDFRLPTKVFDVVMSRMKALVKHESFPGVTAAQMTLFWARRDMLCFTRNEVKWSVFPNISISLSASHNTSFTLHISPQQYLRAMDPLHTARLEEDCFKFAVESSESGSVLGAVIMEGYYVVFDREKSRVGFARTTCNTRDATYATSTISGYHHTDNGGAVFSCAYIPPKSNNNTMLIVAYVMAGVCVVCAIPLIMLLVQWLRTKWKTKHDHDGEGLL